jgi:formylglycine-generating enzyme required for sulfatase activity
VSVGSVVTLDGSLSLDPDGDTEKPILLYHWIVGTVPGGAVELSDSTAVQPTFIASEPGDYVFGLEVTDGDLTSLLDVVTIRVVDRIFAEQNGMIEIPEGAFSMGSHQGAPDERPPHRVELSTYWIDKFEVTTGLYQACIDAGVCSETAMTSGCNSGRADRLEHPVNCVSWDQAKTFCLWQAKRLPTEAEWERAARGDDGRTYPWGEDFPTSQLLNFNNNIGATTPVGTYPLGISFYGLHNMGGNVQEWTADFFAGDYYAQSPTQNPQGPDSGSLRVGRGASWKLGVPLEVLTSTVRGAFVPNTIENSVGFRCASDISPAP